MSVRAVVREVGQAHTQRARPTPSQTHHNKDQNPDPAFNNLYSKFTEQKNGSKHLNDSKGQQTSQSGHLLPIKSTGETKRIRSYKALVNSAQNSTEGKFSLADSHNSNGLVDLRSKQSEYNLPFCISVKKTTLSRSKSPRRSVSPLVAHGSENGIRMVRRPTVNVYAERQGQEEMIKIEVCNTEAQSQLDTSFTALIKKKQLGRRNTREDRSISVARLKESKDTQCVSEEGGKLPSSKIYPGSQKGLKICSFNAQKQAKKSDSAKVIVKSGLNDTRAKKTEKTKLGLGTKKTNNLLSRGSLAK